MLIEKDRGSDKNIFFSLALGDTFQNIRKSTRYFSKTAQHAGNLPESENFLASYYI